MREIKFNRTDFIAVYDEVYSKDNALDAKIIELDLKNRRIKPRS